tara:strand:- start:68 stop:262 length:195 start_codon:yes stop_codon:yes gene_type:complete
MEKEKGSRELNMAKETLEVERLLAERGLVPIVPIVTRLIRRRFEILAGLKLSPIRRKLKEVKKQ